MEKEEYIAISKTESDQALRHCNNYANKLTDESVHKKIRDLAKLYQLGEKIENERLEDIVKEINIGLKKYPSQLSYYQSILKSYPQMAEKDKELKEKGEI